MQVFEYTGQLSSGTAISGTLEAASADDARRNLHDMRIHVSTLVAAPAIKPARPLSRQDLEYFNQQLASLAESGIALDQGLRLLAKDIRSGRLQKTVEALASDLEAGIPFDEAVERRGSLFPPLYADVIRAGIKNNQLGSTLFNLNSHFTLMEASRKLFWEAAAYPVVVLSLGLCLLTAFMRIVMPQFAELIADYGATDAWYDYDSATSGGVSLPGMTLFFIWLSTRWWHILGIVMGVPVVLATILSLLRMSSGGRSFRESLILITPGLSSVYRTSLIARFAEAAALGARAGQDLPSVLRAAAGATGSAALVQDANRLSSHIEAGGQPEQTAVRTNLLPAIFGYTAQIAGGRGQLASALSGMARNFDALARHRMVILKAFMMPFMILATAMILGTGMLAIFMPLISIMHSMTGGGF